MSMSTLPNPWTDPFVRIYLTDYSSLKQMPENVMLFLLRRVAHMIVYEQYDPSAEFSLQNDNVTFTPTSFAAHIAKSATNKLVCSSASRIGDSLTNYIHFKEHLQQKDLRSSSG